ncbi:helix-turn-helix domain-containing protein [Paenibacillus sp. J5C_2022]|uniref:helix-turn-helix domain-containing protein n=1 Tax=Paenibacillus sp. J5C2022 TaxID=2977129 RepID=UPI0021CFAE22|nr:helix-turn-helix domain-containing protein [Paenibacillus sp. J5C2022]MCU6712560.1 helix-turn-helix domain-containing protein [Paenibacillus sp. J5C2022]
MIAINTIFKKMLNSVLSSVFKEQLWTNRFYHYLFSYILLVAMLLILVGWVVYRTFISTLVQDVQNGMEQSLNMVKESFDVRITEMRDMAEHISSNPLLTPYKMNNKGYGAYQAIEELKKYNSTNNFIDDVFVYYNTNSSSLLYAASGSYNVESFFGYINEYENWTSSAFMKLVNDMTLPIMRPLETVSQQRLTTRQYATYLYPIDKDSSATLGVVFYLIEENALKKEIQHILRNYQGIVYILNENNEKIAHFQNKQSSEDVETLYERSRYLEMEEPYHLVELNQKDYSVIKLKSTENGWSYVTVMPTDQFFNKVNKSRNIFILMIFSVSILGMLMAIAFSIRNYKPVRMLSGDLGKMDKENKGLIGQLKSQTMALKEQYLQTIIRGKVRNRAELAEVVSMSNLQLDKPYFAVMIFQIDDYNQFVNENSKQTQTLFKYSIAKAVEELSEEAGSGYSLELMNDGCVVLLLNLNEGYNNHGYLMKLANEARQFINQYYHFTVTIGISDISNDLLQINQSFLNANYAVRYRFVQGSNQIISYDYVKTIENIGYTYPVSLVEQIGNAIKQGNSDEVNDLIVETINWIRDKKMSVEAAESIGVDIINTIIKSVVDINITFEEKKVQSFKRLDITQLETIEQLQTELTDFCMKVCLIVRSKKESKNFVLLDNLTRYVNSNYCDPLISLDKISSEFGISASYATRFFKDQTGTSLMHHIDQLRMKKAKQLLLSTNETLKEIINQIGYVDTTNFIRKFKKNEGVTPIQYRGLAKVQTEKTEY